MIVERFAPSPTGPLHLGHAFSAWTAWEAARRAGGKFLLRMEDLDRSRFRVEHVEGIERDLAWLGIDWDGDILFQSQRQAAYEDALALLADSGLAYRCRCTRRDIAEAVSAPQEGVSGPDGLVYPGTCRGAGVDASEPHAIRIDMAGALERLGEATGLTFLEIGAGPAGEHGIVKLDAASLTGSVGDIVLKRRDGAVAYHLAVVVDDAFQQVSHVTRGRDLFSATSIHRVLQALLDLPTPVYRHHALVRDDAGRRLAKRDDARSIATYRDTGLSAREVLELARSNAR